ncbi:hypothetical protein SBADM41S_06835 [Streptomyces badius]
MKEAGVNSATVGVFSWAKIEPRPGVREFGWLDRLDGPPARSGIGVVLATPTSSPPPWMGALHPETLPRTEDGFPSSTTAPWRTSRPSSTGVPALCGSPHGGPRGTVRRPSRADHVAHQQRVLHALLVRRSSVFVSGPDDVIVQHITDPGPTADVVLDHSLPGAPARLAVGRSAVLTPDGARLALRVGYPDSGLGYTGVTAVRVDGGRVFVAGEGIRIEGSAEPHPDDPGGQGAASAADPGKLWAALPCEDYATLLGRTGRRTGPRTGVPPSRCGTRCRSGSCPAASCCADRSPPRSWSGSPRRAATTCCPPRGRCHPG